MYAVELFGNDKFLLQHISQAMTYDTPISWGCIDSGDSAPELAEIGHEDGQSLDNRTTAISTLLFLYQTEISVKSKK